MRYHAMLVYSEKHFFWNHTKENIITQVLTPFIQGQVILVKQRSGIRMLLNLRNASTLKIYKTDGILKSLPGKHITKQIEDPEFVEKECTEELIQDAKLNLAQNEITSLLQKSFSKQKKQVFVIMKFGDKKLDSAYQGVIRPLFIQYGFEVIRVDEVPNSGKISDQILEFIATSQIILSELSGNAILENDVVVTN